LISRVFDVVLETFTKLSERVVGRFTHLSCGVCRGIEDHGQEFGELFIDPREEAFNDDSERGDGRHTITCKGGLGKESDALNKRFPNILFGDICGENGKDLGCTSVCGDRSFIIVIVVIIIVIIVVVCL